MEKQYIINESELIELLHDSLKLCALEESGVDNWEWYGESCNNFLNTAGYDDFYDFAKNEINNYDILED